MNNGRIIEDVKMTGFYNAQADLNRDRKKPGGGLAGQESGQRSIVSPDSVYNQMKYMGDWCIARPNEVKCQVSSMRQLGSIF